MMDMFSQKEVGESWVSYVSNSSARKTYRAFRENLVLMVWILSESSSNTSHHPDLLKGWESVLIRRKFDEGAVLRRGKSVG